jgi:hypothetical protein
MELLPGSKPIREKPQKFSGNKSAFKATNKNSSHNELINYTPLNNEVYDIILAEPDINPKQVYNDENEDRKTLSLRILNGSKYKYTNVINDEYMKKLQPLEGRPYAHPRIRRIHEITTENFLSQLENCCWSLTGNGWCTHRENNTSKSLELSEYPKNFLESH